MTENPSITCSPGRPAGAAFGIFVLVVGSSSRPATSARGSPRISRRASRRAVPTAERHRAGNDAEMQTLAARYGARVKKRCAAAPSSRSPAASSPALSADPDVDAPLGDVPVRRMAVTTEAIGADQVWSGLDGLRASPAAASAWR